MALIQQPYFNAGTFYKPINIYLNQSLTNASIPLSIGGNNSYSNDFATYSSGQITITKSGFYNVNFQAKTSIVQSSSSTGVQFQMRIGTNIYLIQAGSTSFPAINDFSVSDSTVYLSTGWTQITGSIVTTVGPFAGGITVSGLMYKFFQNIYINSGDVINYIFVRNAGSGANCLVALDGSILIDKVS